MTKTKVVAGALGALLLALTGAIPAAAETPSPSPTASPTVVSATPLAESASPTGGSPSPSTGASQVATATATPTNGAAMTATATPTNGAAVTATRSPAETIAPSASAPSVASTPVSTPSSSSPTPTLLIPSPSATPSITAAPRLTVNGTTADARCPATIPSVVRVNGQLQYMAISQPTQNAYVNVRQGTTPAAGINGLAYVDESGLMVGLAGSTLKAYRMDSAGRITTNNTVSTSFYGAQHVIGAGRGFFYVVFQSGAFGVYQLNVQGTSIVYWKVPATTGWGGFKAFTSSNDGNFYAVHSNGQFLQYQKTQPFTGENRFQRRVMATGWGNVTDVESPGDGLVYSFRADGTAWRHFQADPAGMGYFRSGPLDTWRGTQVFGLLTMNPSSCNPMEAKVRAAIVKRSLAWVGTGSSFCNSHSCNPGWCVDFAWSMWIETGITNWQPYRSPSTLAHSKYGAAMGTSKGRNIAKAKVGDIVVWGPVGGHVGHVGVITKVYGNGYIDYMNGNYSNATKLLVYKDPLYSSSWLGPYDDIVSPRL